MIKKIKSLTPLSGLYIIYKGGVNLESPGTRGMSHLIEHLLCRGMGKLKSKFFTQGITQNAWTSQNEVVFYFTGIWDRLKLFIPEILDHFQDPTLSSEYINKEKKIIIQEWDEWHIDTDNWAKGCFFRQCVGSSGPIGERDDITNFKQIEVIKFWERNFFKPSSIILVSPDIKYELSPDLIGPPPIIKKEWSIIENGENLLPILKLEKTIPVIIYSQLIDKDFAWINFINYLLSKGNSSLLYKKIRDKKGLVYKISASQKRFDRKTLIQINSITNSQKIEEVQQSILDILNELPQLIDEKIIEKVTENLRVKKQIDRVNRYNSVNDLIEPQNWSVYKILDDITHEKVKEKALQYFNLSNFKIYSVPK